jgi:excisionase family DNA binding protein
VLTHSRQRMPTRTSRNGETQEIRSRLLLTVEEAARLLSVGRPKMWQLVMAGEVLSVKIGTSRRVPVAALEAFVGRLSAGAPSASTSTREEPYESAR